MNGLYVSPWLTREPVYQETICNPVVQGLQIVEFEMIMSRPGPTLTPLGGIQKLS